MENKTNALRVMDKAGQEYNIYVYDNTQALSGTVVAGLIGVESDRVFKTLVTVGKSGKNYVFMIPVNNELDLKKCAKAVNEKSVEMLKMKDLFNLTGYVHGGCSPVGMKKQFLTVVDSVALKFEKIVFSAGKIGLQVEIPPKDLLKFIQCSFLSISISGNLSE